MSSSALIEHALEHLRGGSLDKAADLCRRTLDSQPDNPTAWQVLGTIMRQHGDPSGALDAFRAALAHAPACTEALIEGGEALLDLVRPQEALAWFDRALPLEPASVRIWTGLGDALHALGRLPEAILAYGRALQANGPSPRACWGLGCACLRQGEFAAAAAALQQLTSLDPARADGWQNLGKALYEIGQIDESLAAFRKAAHLLGPHPFPLGSIATMIPGSPQADAQAILDARRAWGAFHRPAAPVLPGHTHPRAPGPLRIGYVSSFFQHRNWMKPVWGLINHHDRSRFAIHLFSDAPLEQIGESYRRHPDDRYHDIRDLANEDVARLVAEASIDVLVDLNAYSRPARLLLFLLRPAPVQIEWFGAFSSSGLDCFDAVIADAHVLPPGAEAFCSEPVVRIPACYLTFEVGYPVPDVSPPPCLAGGPVTWGCLAPLYKITPQVLEAWSRILQHCPGSRLLLTNTAFARETNRAYVRDQFSGAGIDAGRLLFEGPAEHYGFLERYADVDLALDTFPYNGGTTTAEALWQGVPVLTFAGDRWSSRISASLLHHAGLSELVAGDLEGHVRQAIELANDPGTPAWLARFRSTARDRLREAAVCNVRDFARAMETVYERLWTAAAPPALGLGPTRSITT